MGRPNSILETDSEFENADQDDMANDIACQSNTIIQLAISFIILIF